MATFADRFKSLRLEKGLTQQQIAEIFYCNKSSISRYESGNQIPETATLNQYADFFSVTIDYLLGRTDDKNNIVLEGKYLPKELQGIIDAVSIAKDSGLSDQDIKEILELHTKMRKKS